MALFLELCAGRRYLRSMGRVDRYARLTRDKAIPERYGFQTTRADSNILEVTGVLAPHFRIGGYKMNKEKYEKPEISTEVLEPTALCIVTSDSP